MVEAVAFKVEVRSSGDSEDKVPKAIHKKKIPKIMVHELLKTVIP
jgi:hypothetical protein